MKILVLNCGSSSIKYQLFRTEDAAVLAKGLVDKIGLQGSCVKHEKENGSKVIFEGEILDHKAGIEYTLGILVSEKHGCLKVLEEIDAIGHRIAHGGEYFKESCYLDDDAISKIEKCAELAPLHNPAHLKGIYALKELLPTKHQVGVFDTSFHQTMPEHVYKYAIPNKLYEKYGIRRYGFHGTSHRYVANKACEFLGVDIKTQKIISCHLGNGASVCAVQYGESVDTSMGFTPVEGLMMGTRAGDLDIGAVTFIMEKENIGLSTANTLFNKHSGLLGITKVSSDMREVEAAAAANNEAALLAMKMFDYRIKKYVGAYAAAMGGVDIILFTGGIGEHNKRVRRNLCSGLEFFGVELDQEKNDANYSMLGTISKSSSKVNVMVVPTDEELVIALDTETIVTKL